MELSTELERRVVAAALASSPEVEVLPCDPALADTAAFCEAYGVPPERSANTIICASKREPRVFVACLVLATTRLDVNGAVKRRLGAGKVSFAGPEDTVGLTGMQVGGVTPFGLPEDLPIWVDAAVADQPWVVVGGGSRSIKLRVPPASLLALPGAELVEGLATPAPPAPPAEPTAAG